jgi:hypothetical protein
MTALYADLLGTNWKVLPESVRRLHENGGEGTFRVERRGIARFLPFLPPAGEKISIHLRVVRTGDAERWIRTFDGVHVVNSVQRSSRGAIIERFGPISISMTLAVSSDALRYHLVGIRILGIKIPFSWLPRTVASELTEGPFVRVVVRIGDSFAYSGVVRPR